MKLGKFLLFFAFCFFLTVSVFAAEQPNAMPSYIPLADSGSSLYIKTTADGIQYSVKSDGTARIEGYSSSALHLTLPSEIDGMPVNEIAATAFFSNTGLVRVTLPDSITQIGKQAFQSCSNLISVVLPSGLQEIPVSCFDGCQALQSVFLPDSLREIGDYAFRGCTMLGKIQIPASLQKIGEDAFLSCEQLILQCNDNAYMMQYAKEHHIPVSFWETSTAQWLVIAGSTVVIGCAVLFLRKPMHRFLQKAVRRARGKAGVERK